MLRLIGSMMSYQAYPFMVFSGVILIIALTNHLYMPKLSRSPGSLRRRLSILVPARDEERNIDGCLASLLSQDHPDYEVVVLNDGSRDRTGEIIERLKLSYPNLRSLEGLPLPDGWRGKNWACWQLARAAEGEVLLFTDADTIHAEDSGSCACSALMSSGAGLISGMVRQRMLTIPEMLLVPVMNWAMMCFMPLPLAHVRGRFMLPAACGQFMAFTKDSYRLCGGHEAIKGKVLDDAELARSVKAAGMRSLLYDATGKVSCRMYTSAAEAVAGFTKNLFSVFRNRVLLHIFIWTWLLITTMVPLIYLLAYPGGESMPAALISAALTLSYWSVAFSRAKVPLPLAFAYPVMLPLWFWLAMRSMAMVLSGKATWKGRGIGRGQFRI